MPEKLIVSYLRYGGFRGVGMFWTLPTGGQNLGGDFMEGSDMFSDVLPVPLPFSGCKPTFYLCGQIIILVLISRVFYISKLFFSITCQNLVYRDLKGIWLEGIQEVAADMLDAQWK